LEAALQIYDYRGKGSRRFLYEKMKNWLDSLVCVGDSVAAINPFYAQGITMAALNALALGDFIRSKSLRKGSAAKLQKRLAKVNLLRGQWQRRKTFAGQRQKEAARALPCT
jgi:2-polyprenyl-6-methoxyphenol hydroxylase-like FAD-dependent oxidoreductase